MSHRLQIWSLLFLVGLLFLSNTMSQHYELNLKGLDSFTYPHRPHPDVVILAIDAKSLNQLGRWPWSRTVHAQILNKLNDYTPSVVAFDVTFTHPESTQADDAFRQSLANADYPVVLAEEGVYKSGAANPVNFSQPIDAFRSVAKVTLGHVVIHLSRDGLAREFPQPISIDKTEYLPLTTVVAQLVKATPPPGERLIKFAGPAGTFQSYSASDLLAGTIPKEDLNHKIILIGATTSDLRDTVLTPQKQSVMAGVELYANVLDNILLKRSVVVLPPSVPWLLGALIGLAYWVAFSRMRTQTLSVGLTILLVALPFASYILWQFGIALPYFAALLFVVGIIIFHGLYNWYRAEAEKRRIRETFQYYFSPQVLEEILKDPDKLKLGGQKREMTILFSDIRSFTTITESLPPERLTRLLHEYFNEMMASILATDGVVDKFIGDAIMAFWGAPIEQDNQADLAVKAALGMIKRLEAAQKKWLADGYPLLDIGIGINTGVVTLGNMGSDTRFDYTVIGDDVNAAARLEGLNKEYKTHIIISESTKKKLTIKVKTKPLGEVVVKGKTKPLKIFEVMDKK